MRGNLTRNQDRTGYRESPSRGPAFPLCPGQSSLSRGFFYLFNRQALTDPLAKKLTLSFGKAFLGYATGRAQ